MKPIVNRRDCLAQLFIGSSIYCGTFANSNTAGGTPTTKPDTTIRVGVIGHTGRGDFGHGLDKMWQRLPETNVVAISDSAGSQLAKKRMPHAEAFGDYETMLKVAKPEVVAVAPRHIDQHHQMCLAAIHSGARAIYVEKPFCQTPRQADEIVNACEQNGVKLAVAHRNRYHPVLATVKKLIAAGEIGEPLELRGRGKEDQRGGGLDLWVLGSHVLNIGCYFGGSPIACQARLYQDGRACDDGEIQEGAEGVGPLAGNELHARYDMSSGLPLFFDTKQNRGSRAAGFGLQIIGNEGVIDLRMDKEPLAQIMKGNPFQPIANPSTWQPITTAGIGQRETIANLGASIASHQVAGNDLIQSMKNHHQPKCDAVEGRQNIEMICATFESHQHSGKAVTFPLDRRDHPLS